MVFAYESGRQLVLKITASVSDADMEFGHLAARLLLVLRPLLLFRVPPRHSGQALFFLAEEVLVARFLARPERHRVQQAQIDPDGCWRDWEGLDIFFDQERDAVAPSGILRHRDGGGPGAFRQGATPPNRQRPGHLRQGQGAAIPGEGRGGVLRRLAAVLFLEGGILCPTIKEVLEGFVQVAQGRLWWDTGDLIQPARLWLLFQDGQRR